jgi:hypothetical protein
MDFMEYLSNTKENKRKILIKSKNFWVFNLQNHKKHMKTSKKSRKNLFS